MTTIELLREENKVLTAENDRLRLQQENRRLKRQNFFMQVGLNTAKPVSDDPKYYSVPLATRILAWTTILLAAATGVLIVATAILTA